MIRVDGTWEEHEEFLKKEAYEDGLLAGKTEDIEIGKKAGAEMVLANLDMTQEEMDALRRKIGL